MKIAVIGAGITGLSLGWYLQQAMPGVSLTIFEKEDYAGGMIQTTKQPFFFEKGPRTFAAERCPELLSLIEEVGLKQEIIFAEKISNKRWIYEQGSFRKPVPLSLLIKALYADLFSDHQMVKQDLTVAEFFSTRYGEAFTCRCIDPLVSGIYAGDIRKLSLEMAFPSIWKSQEKYSSLLYGLWKSKPEKKGDKGLFTLRKGMQQLIGTLSTQLPIVYKATPTLTRKGNKTEVVIGERAQVFDKIFVTTSPDSLFKEEFPLLDVSYNPLIAVNCGYRSQSLSRKGFGYLIPSQENEEILGCVFDSQIFPQQSCSPQELRMTLMMGGAHHKEMIYCSEEIIREKTISALSRHLSLPQPDFIKIHYYPQAIAHYPIGFSLQRFHWIEKIKQQYPGVIFTWSALGDPAVNGRIAQSKKAVEIFILENSLM